MTVPLIVACHSCGDPVHGNHHVWDCDRYGETREFCCECDDAEDTSCRRELERDYDPLALPAAYFEGLPTGVPNNLPSQPEPVKVPEQCACPCEHCTSFRHRPYECSLKKGGRDDWWAVGELEALIEKAES